MPSAFQYVYFQTLMCKHSHCLFLRDVCVASVHLARVSLFLSRPLTCSAASLGIWHRLKSPPYLGHMDTHTHTQTQSAEISWDSVTSCRLFSPVRENRERQDQKGATLKGPEEKQD